ncbi:PLC-like phosphodiesterase [Immersiella caudata]|uniref:PLC-like phosphodiesterase n=1 Tax=Immersiella caudata TaxID=314043 RepID=A0AA39WEY6_9PEZI|nr:PLC-like phosphodiesterase [Immersiella caudata]
MGSSKRSGAFLALLALSINTVCGQSAPTISTDDPALTILTGTKTPNAATVTGTYQTFSSTITLATTALTGTGPIVGNATSTSSSSGSPNTVTFLTGSASTASGNASTTSTVAAPVPTNTRPCNNYPEFCDRKYSNITVVGAHNSPFVRQGSAAANQQLGVIDQLNDGIRFLQAQIQWPTNGSVPHFCHSSCDLLDAGPITDWLSKVRDWVSGHPYDVVTILLGNGNYSRPELYVPFIESTGILQYVYTPPLAPMSLEDWPTLAQMILTGQRVVMFLDYDTNQTAYPWLIDQFSNMWETPFDPVDREFPCTVQRPPDLKPEDAKRRLYMMNHNLNVEVSLLGTSILVPAVSELNITNNATGKGSLGASAENCRAQWGNPPTVLNVDYYNFGGYPGSVFEAAAMMNNVTYNRPCCGVAGNAATRVETMASLLGLGLAWGVLSLVL